MQSDLSCYLMFIKLGSAFVLETNFEFQMSCLAAGPPTPAAHLRDVFYRMGLNDKVIIVDKVLVDLQMPC